MYDELVKRLRNEAECPDNYPEDSVLMREAADAIEELSKPKWIPVTERLPEEHVFVLVRQDDDRMMIAVRVDGDWWYRYFAYDVDRWDENEQGTITHWMPLPQPPKEE